jgi:hypothetical protein
MRIFLSILLLGYVPLEATWTPPVTIATPALQPQVGMDSAGNGVAIWTKSDTAVIQTATLPLSGSWTMPVTISATGSTSPDLAVGDDGTAFAVWKRSSSIQAATSLNGTVWSSATTLTANGSQPVVSTNESGEAVATWTADGSPPKKIQASQFNGSSWWSITNVSVGGTNASLSQIALNPAGDAISVWVQSDGANQRVMASSGDGLAWSMPTAISDAAQDSSNPAVAIDSAGNGIAVWYTFTGTTYEVKASTFNGISWTLPTRISPVGLNSFTPQVVMDGSGNAFTVWEANTGTGLQVLASTLPVGSTVWSDPAILSAVGGREPQIAVTPDGNAVAIWQLLDASGGRVQAATLPFGGAWSSPVDLSLIGSIGSNSAHVAIDADGNALAIWSFTPLTNALIPEAQSSYGFGLFIPTAPTQFLGTTIRNEFLTQTDVIHRLTWIASTDPDITHYLLQRNGDFLAEIPASGPLEYNDHHRKDAVDTYTLVAVNSLGVESVPVTVVVGL